jgi:RHS repeat-associated protein
MAYGWDANGNLTTKDGEATYTWDHENRLTKVTKADGTVVEHAYDAEGSRVRTKVTPPTGPPEVTDYLVDTSGSLSHVVAETDPTAATPALKALYVRGDDLLAVMRPLVSAPVSATDWQTRYYHADGIGSIRRLTDEAGTIADGYTYNAFGELLSHTGSDPQPYAFTGEALDQNSGWQYHRARWMDPRTGRWASMDPFGGFLSEPVTLLRYLYSGVDPVNKLDRNGEQFSTVQVLAIGAIIGILVANFRHPPQTIGQIASVNLGGAAAGVTVAGGFLGAQYLLFRLATYGAAGAGSAEAIHKSLEAAARSGGPTIGVTTAQTTAPAVGRTLYVVEGVGLEAQRAAAHFGPGRPLWEGQIPKQLFFELQRLGLVSDGYLPSGAKEIAFRAEASRYLVDFFTRIP